MPQACEFSVSGALFYSSPALCFLGLALTVRLPSHPVTAFLSFPLHPPSSFLSLAVCTAADVRTHSVAPPSAFSFLCHWHTSPRKRLEYTRPPSLPSAPPADLVSPFPSFPQRHGLQQLPHKVRCRCRHPSLGQSQHHKAALHLRKQPLPLPQQGGQDVCGGVASVGHLRAAETEAEAREGPSYPIYAAEFKWASHDRHPRSLPRPRRQHGSPPRRCMRRRSSRRSSWRWW